MKVVTLKELGPELLLRDRRRTQLQELGFYRRVRPENNLFLFFIDRN